MYNEIIEVDKNFNLNFASVFKVKCGHDKKKHQPNKKLKLFCRRA